VSAPHKQSITRKNRPFLSPIAKGRSCDRTQKKARKKKGFQPMFPYKGKREGGFRGTSSEEQQTISRGGLRMWEKTKGYWGVIGEGEGLRGKGNRVGIEKREKKKSGGEGRPC